MTKNKDHLKNKELVEDQYKNLALNTDKVEIFQIPEKESEDKRVSYFQLQYRFADKLDYFLIIIATIGSLAAGASMPLISLLLGTAINNFGPNVDKSELSSKVTVLAINYILCGIGILLGSFMMSFFWSIVAKRLIYKMNVEYFQVLLRQEQGYFDQGQKNEHFVTKINQEIKIIENGVNLKFIALKIF
jgi:ATP-binding cassette subfamily B (MDR/TAP) protein 1